MQVKRCHFPGFTAKNAGDPVVFKGQKQKKRTTETITKSNTVLNVFLSYF